MQFWLLKYELLSYAFSLKQKIKRFIFCRNNQHQIVGNSTSVVNAKKQEIKSEYVRCVNCNIHYFPSKKHKDDYLRIQERDKQHNKNIVEMMVKMQKENVEKC